MQRLAEVGITATAKTVVFSEESNCGGTSLVNVELELEVLVPDLEDQAPMAVIAPQVREIVRDVEDFTGRPGQHFELQFVVPESTRCCVWDFQSEHCS